jgi:20S proteasome subunit beta 5
VDDSGSCVQGNLFSVGSGSLLAYSILDSKLSSFSSKDEAINAALSAVKHATYRDGFSGGYINVLEVNETGIFHLYRTDCRNIHLEDLSKAIK